MFQKGQLVNWYETYGDINIAKDAGLGIITSIEKLDYFREPVYIFNVYRIKHGDRMNFEHHHLEKIRSKK